MEVKIKDFAFSHTDYSTLQKSKHFKWVRHDEKSHVSFFTDGSLPLVNNSNDDKKVAWLIEPRAINNGSYNFILNNHHLFDYVLTYDRELLNISNKFLYYPHGGCWINEDDFKIYDKSKFCSIIASSKNQTIGHKLRHSVISSINNMDVYGNGYNRLENKIEGIKEYNFSIVIENSKQDDYFTEKLIDTLICGTVPLYWGTNNINNYFINIPIFNTIDELKGLLNYYSHNEYPKEYILENYNRALKYIIPEDYIFENYKFLFT